MALLQKSIVLSHQWGRSSVGIVVVEKLDSWHGLGRSRPSPHSSFTNQGRRQCGGGDSSSNAAARRSGGGGTAIGWRRRRQHLWRKCIHWHCTLVFGSFKHHHDCILPLSLLDGYSYSIFVISNLSTLMQLTVYFCKICSIFVIFIHHKLVTFEV